jgi:hypothetical protein
MTLTCPVSQAALVDRCAVLGESAAGGERLQALCGVRAGHMAHLHLAALPRRQDWLLGHLPLLQLPGVRSTAVGPCHRLEDCLQEGLHAILLCLSYNEGVPQLEVTWLLETRGVQLVPPDIFNACPETVTQMMGDDIHVTSHCWGYA